MKFFIKIRKKMLFQANTIQYLKYAIGEIILVVIGILIALQINNWNQRRLDKKNEQIYLNGLKEEFQISKRKLEELRSVNQKNYNGAKKIIEYINSENQLPTEELFSKLLYQTFSNDIAYNPNNSLLNEMINSGNLKNLSNTSLRKELTNWISSLEDVAKQEDELSIQRVKVLDMFRNSETDLSAIFKHAGIIDMLGLPNTKTEISNLILLNSNEFHNNVLMFIFTNYATEKAHFEPLMQDLNTIIKQINQELDQQ
ncbi:MAG: hypothetical protein KDC50_06620 [Flavobacterium sp.]|nr:hypothetical protein [Flavobacterium sp.]